MTTRYNVYAEGELMMTAPMLVIASAFGMHRDATHRVVSELTREPVSKVCFNGRPTLLGMNKIQICKSDYIPTLKELDH